MESLRIAMFSDSALPILNGVSISVDALIGELRNQGHSVHLFAPRCRGPRDADPNTVRFRAIGTPWAPNYPIPYPPFYRKLLEFRRNRYDLVHTHTPFVTGLVGLRWAESHELPIVSTYHTLYDRYAHYLALAPKRYVRFRIAKHTNFYYNRVDHVVTPSEAALKWLRRHSIASPITVIPTGIRGRGFHNRSEVRQELGITPEQRVMLYVGRLAREKNLPLLFEMAANVIRNDPLARLLIVGDGPFRSDCTRIARRAGIGDRTRFVGFVPRLEVDRYYAASDLFVFSSITETQGLVVQEALSHGIPAIAVAGGGAGASIRDGLNGYVVRNEAQAFTEKVLMVLGDQELYERLCDGAARSVRHLGVGAMVEKMLEVYRETLERKASMGKVEELAWIQ
jgi:glycosyltransferase involved in cell wall biosynthesis